MKTIPVEGEGMTIAAGGYPPHLIKKGVAKQMWCELLPWPDQVRSLWLQVDGRWKYLHSPSTEIERAVQQAFSDYPDDNQQIMVYFHDSEIVGLVLKSKEAT